MTQPSMTRSATIVGGSLILRLARTFRSFYGKALGFTLTFQYRIDETKPDPCYMGFQRDTAWLHMSSFRGDGVNGSCAYLRVENVDELHEEREVERRRDRFETDGSDLGQP
ncbi:MAG: hypothetical protein ACI841_003339 [Planctomycetota bacterium]|jgi:hypothetical protein